MNIPNPRSLFTRGYDERALMKSGIGAIQGLIGDLEARIDAANKIVDKIDSPEFNWLVQTYLPAERRRIETERSQVPPADTVKQCMVQGQLNEIDVIQNELPAMQARIDAMMSQLKVARGAEAAWYKRNGKRKE